MDRQRRRLDQLARFRRNRLHADQPAAAFFNHQLDEAACVEIGERARHVVERQQAAVGLDAVVMRFRLAVADRGDLRIGEHHGRHRGQIDGGVTAGHVDRRAGTGRCCHVDELRLVGTVTGRIDVFHAGPHAGVDDDRALQIDRNARRVQRQVACVRRAAGGDQQPVGAQFAVRRGEHEFAVRMGNLAGLRVFQHFDLFGAKRRRDCLADSRVFTEEQCAARQDRHLAAESGERLRQLQRDDRRTDHGQPLRDSLADQRLGGSPIRRVLQARNWRHGRTRAGGDQATVERHHALAAAVELHDQVATVFEAGFAMQHSDGGIAVQNAFVFGVAQLIDACLLLGQQIAALNRRFSRCNAAVERAFPSQVGNMGGADHNLGRYAADIDAGAADGAALN